ncbi:solute carrier family 49 member 4 homolog [Watersipora subatra]|uniref:solute carrier family 49 member 4 homolog n=1 Tax=Watersipora subatra TaxID=2589382 RepID=UPI00355C6CBE
MSSDENQPLLIGAKNITIFYEPSVKKPPASPEVELCQPQVYKRRWWTLFVFSFCVFNQGLSWLIWKPLSDSLLVAYNWDLAQIGLAGTFTAIVFVVFSLPVMYVVESRGIRVGVLIASSSLVAAGIVWNCALYTEKLWLFLSGAAIIGIAPTVTAVMASLFSVTWFPVSQRTTATSISVMSLHLAFIIGYIAGPQISGSAVTVMDMMNKQNLTEEYMVELKSGLRNVGYFVTGITGFGLLLTIIYFPAAPPTPPSVCQTVKREDFWSGLKKLGRNSQYIIQITAFTLTNATVYAWLPLISVSFRVLGIDQLAASWLSMCATIVGTIALLLISISADHPYFKRKTKLILKVCAAASIVLLLLLACIQKKWIHIPDDGLLPVLYILVIGVNISALSIFPICSELACEYAYPVYEGLACTVFMMANGLVAGIFYALLLIPALAEDTTWMTWNCLLGSCFTLPLLFLLKDDYRRLDLDEHRNKQRVAS